MSKEINEVINAVCAASSNIIAAIDNIEINPLNIVNTEDIVKYIHEQCNIISDYTDNNNLSSKEQKINNDFIKNISYIYYSTETYEEFLIRCYYDNKSPIEKLKRFCIDLKNNPVLLSEIKTTHDV